MKILTLFLLPFLFSFLIPLDDREIVASEFDIPFLENLVNEKINDLRKQKKLSPLVHDSTLYASAKGHCDYMVRKNKLSHTQSGNSKMKTPQLRAEVNGLEGYWVGENILYTFFNSNVDNPNKRFKTNTYEVLAEAILHSWVTSNSHFKNMINPDYTISGLALSIDFETKKVYVCQDFGKKKTYKVSK